MKRYVAGFAVVLLLITGLSLAASAQTQATYVTDFEYSRLITGGVEDTLLFTAHTESGYDMGQLDQNGERSRTTYTAAGWEALCAPELWETTIHGDAGALCPYAHTHGDSTVCPYLEYLEVTMRHTQNEVVLEHYYVPSEAVVSLPEGTVHVCWGRYGFVSPVSLKWDGESRYMALKNETGLWGVFDMETNAMVTEYAYADMSAVYGDYAKVYNGTAWGRLDLSGVFSTQYIYETEDAFSVREEMRRIGDGRWQAFSADNEAISVVMEGAWTAASYEAGPHMFVMTAQDGTKTMYDLTGAVIARFSASQEVRYLQDVCYAVAQYNDDGSLFGIALLRIDGATQPDDTVLKGDVNFDGAINSSDARLILRYTTGGVLTDRQQAAADLDGLNAITSADARALMTRVIG